MLNRRSFIKLGAILVPVVAAPTVAYSFLRGTEFAMTPSKNVYSLPKSLSANRTITLTGTTGVSYKYTIAKTGADEWSTIRTETWLDGKLIDARGLGVEIQEEKTLKSHMSFSVRETSGVLG